MIEFHHNYVEEIGGAVELVSLSSSGCMEDFLQDLVGV